MSRGGAPFQRFIEYGAIAATYDRRYEENDYSGIERTLLDFVAAEPAGAVIEVGCGTGHWLALLHHRGFRVAGLDASAEMLARARENAPFASLAHGCAERLPWPAASCRRMFCINAFHHFTDKTAFLEEARRVLQPGGAVMIVGLDPHAGRDRWFIYDCFEGTLENDKRRYPAAGEIRRLMADAGFTGSRSVEAQHISLTLPARAALEEGRLDKTVTSQLALLTDEEYRAGIDRIRREIELFEARGEVFRLTADLRLYATFGYVGPA